MGDRVKRRGLWLVALACAAPYPGQAQPAWPAAPVVSMSWGGDLSRQRSLSIGLQVEPAPRQGRGSSLWNQPLFDQETVDQTSPGQVKPDGADHLTALVHVGGQEISAPAEAIPGWAGRWGLRLAAGAEIGFSSAADDAHETPLLSAYFGFFDLMPHHRFGLVYSEAGGGWQTGAAVSESLTGLYAWGVAQNQWVEAHMRRTEGVSALQPSADYYLRYRFDF